METYKKALIAVMDSPSARHAANQGVALAASIGASVVGVSVVPAYEGNMPRLHVRDMQAQIEAPHRKALKELEALAAKANVPCRTVLTAGQPFEAITDMAETEEVDLIVLGGETQSRLERAVLGATVERVIGYARRDTLVIPEGCEVDFSRILLGTDGSRDTARATARALDLARAYGGSVRVVSVVDTPSDYHLWNNVIEEMTKQCRTFVDHVAKEAEPLGVAVETGVLQGDTVDSLLEEAERISAKLIVLGTHGRTGLRRLLMGGVASGVLRQNRFPILVSP